MSRVDLDTELRRVLRSSSDEASPDFNRHVLKRLARRRPPRPLLLRPAFAVGAVALVLVTGLVVLTASRQSSGLEEAARREQLLDEYQALEVELEQLRRLASESAPVLYLGGDETFDVMYDLAAYRQGPPADTIRPASLPDRG